MYGIKGYIIYVYVIINVLYVCTNKCKHCTRVMN